MRVTITERHDKSKRMKKPICEKEIQRSKCVCSNVLAITVTALGGHSVRAVMMEDKKRGTTHLQD